MTRDEYNILKEHGDRLLAIEESIRKLPGAIATEVKGAVRDCRAETEVHRKKVDLMWVEHQREEGAKGLLSNMNRSAVAIIGVLGTIIGIVGTVAALT